MYDRTWEPFDPEEESSERLIKEEELTREHRESHERVNVKTIKCPAAPTKEEIEEHMLTHVPFRSWCPHCTAGQSGRKGHFKGSRKVDERDQVPSVHVDYMYLKSSDKKEEEDDEEKSGMPVLVMLDQESGMTFSSVVPKKGAMLFRYQVTPS